MVPVLSFSTLGWSAWHQDLNSSSFPLQPELLPGLWRGHSQPCPALPSMHCFLTQLPRHLFMLLWGLMLKVPLPTGWADVLLQLLRGLF